VLKRAQSICLAIMLCLIWSAAAQAQPMRFSPSEKAWLNDHQRLRVGVIAQTPPIIFFSDKETPQGLVADYLRAVAQHLGLQLEITRYQDATSLLQALKAGRMDVIGAAIPGDGGKGTLIYTRPYLNLPVALFAKDESPQGGLSALRHKTVVVVSGSVWEKALPSIEPAIQVLTRPSLEQALQSVAEGTAAAYMGDAASANYLLRRQELDNVEEQQRLDLTLDIALATPVQQPELQSLMQKGLDRINGEELQEIWHRWPGVERPNNFNAGLLPVLLIWIPAILLWSLLVGWLVRYDTIRRHNQLEGKFKRAIRRLQRREKRLKQKLLLLKRKALEYRSNDRQHRQQLRLLNDVLPSAAWAWDPKQAMCQWDDDMYRLFQRDPGSFEPTPEAILQCVHAQDREKVALLFEPHDGEGDLRLSYRILLPDGEVRQLLDFSHFSSADSSDGDQRVGICWDISDYMTAFEITGVEQPVES
jgi:ABC-type amino acid transport substrate-binding protein